MICHPISTGVALVLAFWAVIGVLLLLTQDDNGDIRLRGPADAEEAILCGPLVWVVWLLKAVRGRA